MARRWAQSWNNAPLFSRGANWSWSDAIGFWNRLTDRSEFAIRDSATIAVTRRGCRPDTSARTRRTASLSALTPHQRREPPWSSVLPPPYWRRSSQSRCPASCQPRSSGPRAARLRTTRASPNRTEPTRNGAAAAAVVSGRGDQDGDRHTNRLFILLPLYILFE